VGGGARTALDDIAHGSAAVDDLERAALDGAGGAQLLVALGHTAIAPHGSVAGRPITGRRVGISGQVPVAATVVGADHSRRTIGFAAGIVPVGKDRGNAGARCCTSQHEQKDETGAPHWFECSIMQATASEVNGVSPQVHSTARPSWFGWRRGGGGDRE
jgi:hypothetical protein